MASRNMIARSWHQERSALTPRSRRTELCIPVLPLRVELPGQVTGENDDFVSPLLRQAVG